MNKKIIILTVALFGGLAMIFLSDEWDRHKSIEQLSLRNDSIQHAYAEQLALADSLERLPAADCIEQPERQYVDALKTLRAARITAALATPPIDTSDYVVAERRLRDKLGLYKTALERQLELVDGMPAATADIQGRLDTVNAVLK